MLLVQATEEREQIIAWTPDIAFTTVDFPWATWPIVPGKADKTSLT